MFENLVITEKMVTDICGTVCVIAFMCFLGFLIYVYRKSN